MLILLAVVPLLAMLVASVVSDRTSALDQARQDVEHFAQLAAEQQARSFDEASTLLSAVRLAPAVTFDGGPACADFVKRAIEAQSQFRTMGLVDPDGQIVCHNLLQIRQTFGDLGLLKAIQAPGSSEFKIGRFMIGRVTGKPTIVSALRLPHPDGRFGMIFVSHNLGNLSSIAESAGSGFKSVLAIEPDSGTIMGQSAVRPSLVGAAFPNHPVMRAAKALPHGGVVETVNFNDRPELIGFAPLPRTSASGAMIAVGVSRANVLAAANHRALIGFALALATTAIALGATWWVGYWTQIRPIRRLAKTAREIGDGALSARATIEPWQAPEFRLLGDALDTMGDRLDQAHSALRESEARYRLLADSATDMVFRLDRDYVRRYVSPASLEILGYAPEELVGRKPVDMIHPEDATEVARVYGAVMAGLDRAEVVNRIRHKNGRWVWVEAELRALKSERTGEVLGLIGALRDISERKKVEETLAASEARFRLLAENTADLVTRLDASGRRLFASPASVELLGYEPEELIGGSPLDIAHPEDAPPLVRMLERLQSGATAPPVQYRVRRRDGAHVWVETSGRPLGEGRGVVLSIRDISRRKRAEDQLASANQQLAILARQDGLTGLANRRCFDESLERELARAAREDQPIALLLADVDKFKSYNDTYGHPAGDEILKQVSRVMEGLVRRPGDLAARYGGEEFAAVLAGADPAGALKVAESFRAAVEARSLPHMGSANGLVTLSIGVVAIRPARQGVRQADMVRQADEALYAAKAAGRNRVMSYSHDAPRHLERSS